MYIYDILIYMSYNNQSINVIIINLCFCLKINISATMTKTILAQYDSLEKNATSLLKEQTSKLEY